MELSLKRIDPNARYEVSLSPGYDEAPKKRMTGTELAQMTISIGETPGSILLRYRQV